MCLACLERDSVMLNFQKSLRLDRNMCIKQHGNENEIGWEASAHSFNEEYETVFAAIRFFSVCTFS